MGEPLVQHYIAERPRPVGSPWNMASWPGYDYDPRLSAVCGLRLATSPEAEPSPTLESTDSLPGIYTNYDSVDNRNLDTSLYKTKTTLARPYVTDLCTVGIHPLNVLACTELSLDLESGLQQTRPRQGPESR